MLWDSNVFIVRQALLELGICLTTFTLGISIALPAKLDPAILAPDSDIKVSPYQGSWMATFFGLGALLGYVITPMVFEFFGRKITNIIINIFFLMGSLILYEAIDAYSLAFARLTQGISVGGTALSIIALCECISPKFRGYFLVLTKISMGLGTIACYDFGFVLSWRQMAVLCAAGNFVSIICLLYSAESPHFYATRGEFDKCADSFTWYRGKSLNAKTELNEFISAQNENLRVKEQFSNLNDLKRTRDMLMSKVFQKSFLIVTLAMLCLNICDRYSLLIYNTDISKELTKNSTVASYFSVVSNFVSIFALALSAVMVKHFPRRTLLFKLGFVSVLFMFIVSFCIALKSKRFFHDLEWLIPALISLQTFIANLGLVPVSFALCGEIYSLDHRALGSFMSGLTVLVFYNVMLTTTPLIIEKTDVEGVFSIDGVLLFILLALLWALLPETKDKTLQQIEDEIKGAVKNVNNTETYLLNKSKIDHC